MPRKTSSFPRHCLLFRKTNSTVPLYADEFVCGNIPSFFNICQRVDRFVDTLKQADGLFF